MYRLCREIPFVPDTPNLCGHPSNRIADIEEMDEIGYEDYFYGNGLTMIEWANLIEEILPDHYRQITIEKDLEKGFDYRRITIEEVER